MPSPTLSMHLRAIQQTLDDASHDLKLAHTLARDIGLAPFRIASIRAAIADNQHAWDELNAVATSLELTGADHKL